MINYTDYQNFRVRFLKAKKENLSREFCKEFGVNDEKLNNMSDVEAEKYIGLNYLSWE